MGTHSGEHQPSLFSFHLPISLPLWWHNLSSRRGKFHRTSVNDIVSQLYLGLCLHTVFYVSCLPRLSLTILFLCYFSMKDAYMASAMLPFKMTLPVTSISANSLIASLFCFCDFLLLLWNWRTFPGPRKVGSMRPLAIFFLFIVNVYSRGEPNRHLSIFSTSSGKFEQQSHEECSQKSGLSHLKDSKTNASLKIHPWITDMLYCTCLEAACLFLHLWTCLPQKVVLNSQSRYLYP